MLHHDTCMQDPFPQTPLRCRPSRLTFGFCLQQIPIYRLAAAALAPFKVQGDREAGALHTHSPWTQNGNGVGEWLFDRHPWPGAIYKRMALQLQHWPLATVYDGRRSPEGTNQEPVSCVLPAEPLPLPATAHLPRWHLRKPRPWATHERQNPSPGPLGTKTKAAQTPPHWLLWEHTLMAT